jgi:uncharacterized protein YbjT (DUF2867 family)
VARALIVACGCRGRELGAALAADGWLVRGTTRAEESLPAIEAAGIEGCLADPDRPGTVLDAAGDVALVFWLLGSAAGDRHLVSGLNGSRLERLVEKLVDSPVRGFVYEAAGTASAADRAAGAAIVRAAGERWRIPVRIVNADPASIADWLEAMVEAATGAVSAGSA